LFGKIPSSWKITKRNYHNGVNMDQKMHLPDLVWKLRFDNKKKFVEGHKHIKPPKIVVTSIIFL
jgi:hypothetical protein